MNQIDHDPHEPKIDRSNKIWWFAWGLVVLLWVHHLYFDGFEWNSFALGAVSGMVLAAWAIDVTGGKVPDSWRKATRRGPGS